MRRPKDVDARDKPGHDEGESSKKDVDARDKPGHDELCEERQLAKTPRRSYKPHLIARTGEICMISMTSQIAPSRPMLMLDARLAL
jgi:hypothetical protein